MQPDARRRADTVFWLEKAHKDLRYVHIDLAAAASGAEPPLFDPELQRPARDEDI